jgi:integrase
VHRSARHQQAANAPGIALDTAEELRLNLTDHQLIQEAVLVNHKEIKDDKSLKRYEHHLTHFVSYLASAHQKNLYSARRKHVLMFMEHLKKHGGSTPHASRVACEWCKQHGYPDGRSGPGWSASYRKSYLAAVRFMYLHFAYEEDLPNHDPSAHIAAPKVVVTQRFTPGQEEVKRYLDAPGRPRDRLLAHWMFYAPSRRQTFSDARWQDIDLDDGTWRVTGRNEKVDVFDLNPLLVRELRSYRRWQLQEATRNRAIRDALGDPDAAYVLLTRTGRRVHPNAIAKMAKWRAIRAGVGVMDAPGTCDAPGGQTSKLSPHALRRGWAKIALNDKGVAIDVVSEVLHHADISTTRKHYAPTKPERAREALTEMKL